MEIRIEPYNLQIKDDSNICPCCSNAVIKTVKKEKGLIGSECGYCRYLDRPFGGCGNTAINCYGGCSCQYGEQDYMYITCENCKSPKCMKCKSNMNCRNEKCGSVVCSSCIEQKQFTNIWKSSSPEEKLYLYGIQKLKILAKNKKIKTYSIYNKNELIDLLIPLVNENDFPIK